MFDDKLALCFFSLHSFYKVFWIKLSAALTQKCTNGSLCSSGDLSFYFDFLFLWNQKHEQEAATPFPLPIVGNILQINIKNISKSISKASMITFLPVIVMSK